MTTADLHRGDALGLLREQGEGMVDCVVTSPPYWRLRDYGEGTTVVWGGEAGCEHEWGEQMMAAGPSQAQGETSQRKGRANVEAQRTSRTDQGCWCQLCGAWHGQLGLEPHPFLYLSHLWAIMEEVKRVLKPTGCAFIVMGDSYCRLKGTRRNYGCNPGKHGAAKEAGATAMNYPNMGDVPEADRAWLRPRQLLLLPSRFAIGCQERGWIVRNHIPWVKPNAMPDPATDRFTTSWEPVFYMTKQERAFFNMEDVLEPAARPGDVQTFGGQKGTACTPEADDPNFRNGSKQWGRTVACGANRHPRDVFIIPTEPSPLPHFAIMPSALARRCVRAGAPPRVCAKCGVPWQREVEVESHYEKREAAYQPNNTPTKVDSTGWSAPMRTPGPWHPACFCAGGETCPLCDGARGAWKTVKRKDRDTDLEVEKEIFVRCQRCKGKGEVGLPGPWEPGLVLDPFAGSGTTGVVAVEEGRRFLGLEISEVYCEMARKRIMGANAPLPLEV